MRSQGRLWVPAFAGTTDFEKRLTSNHFEYISYIYSAQRKPRLLFSIHQACRLYP